MLYLYLLYGATFFATGILLGFQARLPSSVVPRSALGWFAGFALVHAFAEWAKMAVLTPGASEVARLRLDAVGLAIVSFAMLAQFGVVVMRTHLRWPRWTLAIPGVLLVGWLTLVAMLSRSDGLDGGELDALDAAGRYAFALPASALAAWAFWVLRRERAEGDAIGRYLGWASAIFVVYAILAGVIVAPAAFFPASYLNTNVFAAATYVPIEALRTVCAVAMTVVLSRALVLEVARERRELDQRREEFISIVAHDLRSPIGTIHLSTELLQDRLGGLAEGDRQLAAKLLQHIRTGAFGLERMVRDLLDASRIETRMLALEARDVEPRALIGGVVERASQATKGHVVKLVLPDTLPEIHADPMRVEQILVNLLSNAAKFSAPNSEITVEVIVHAHDLELAVTNQGSGLSREDSDKIFSRFYRGGAHSRIEGLGLGLYIAKGLVEAQGGRIWVDSELGKYATFRFTLPRVGAREVRAAGSQAPTHVTKTATT